MSLGHRVVPNVAGATSCQVILAPSVEVALLKTTDTQGQLAETHLCLHTGPGIHGMVRALSSLSHAEGLDLPSTKGYSLPGHIARRPRLPNTRCSYQTRGVLVYR